MSWIRRTEVIAGHRCEPPMRRADIRLSEALRLAAVLDVTLVELLDPAPLQVREVLGEV